VRALALALIAAAAGLASPAQAHLRTNRFDAAGAMRWTRTQLSYGPRPAGSPASRALAERLHSALPHGHYEAVPGGLRNVIGVVPGRDRRDVIVVGAHYDTKDIPGFLGANDGAAGTALVLELARHLTPDTLHPTIVFALFDGEESPDDTPDAEFEQKGLRGSKVAARGLKNARAMILLDFIGLRNVRLPREESSDPLLWQKLRESAHRVGAQDAFPLGIGPDILDDHTPFERVGVPSIDLIDFEYPCFHKLCDDLSQVSERSLNEVGETVRDLLPRL
jgi:glutaminyl-peptide cyclotransferase